MNIFKSIKNYFKNLNYFKKLSVIGGGIFSIFLIMSLSLSLSALLPVKSIIIKSKNMNYDTKEQGAWRVVETINWTDGGKAELVFDINSIIKSSYSKTNVLLVLDISSTMNEGRYLVDDIYKSKLDIMKDSTKNLIDTLLNDQNNSVGLITFDSDARVISNLSKDKDSLISSVDALTAEGLTNYYQALVKADEVFSNSEIDSNDRNVVLFLTDGYPVKDTPNEVGQYKYMKSKYPNIVFNAVSYEMGNNITNEIKRISDNQFVATVDNLYDVLYDASIDPLKYDEFVITSPVDTNYFTVDKSRITNTIGKVEVDDNSKITIDLSNQVLRAGKKEKIVVGLNLKDSLLNKGGIYPTLTGTNIVSKINDNSENVDETGMPVINDSYKVTYDANIPLGCVLSGNVPDVENHTVNTTVRKSDNSISCNGYLFKGWKVASYLTKDDDDKDVYKEVDMINNDDFKMPEANITVRGEWSKLSLNKSMDGTISKVPTLYSIMEDQAVPDNVKSEFVSSSSGISFWAQPSDTNGKGVYQFTSSDREPGENIYYYRGDIDNNNVLFANICWKIVRTTETGGVKLLYNGKPTADGKCTATGEDTTIGKSKFNEKSNSPADAGYMYGERYETKRFYSAWYRLEGLTIKYKSSMSETQFYYSDTVTWDGEKYILDNPGETQLWSSNYRNLEDKYTCFSDQTSCTEVYSITYSFSFATDYVILKNGNTKEKIVDKWSKINYVFGNDVSWDGKKYTLTDTIEVSPLNITKKDKYYYSYSCLSTDLSCDTIYYFVTDAWDSTYYFLSYLTFTDGEDIEKVKEKMYSNVNDSIVKGHIDSWYENNLLPYTNYLEDTIWCNRRKSLTDDADNINGLSCFNQNDKLTTMNGLKYPIALLTYYEYTIIGEPKLVALTLTTSFYNDYVSIYSSSRDSYQCELYSMYIVPSVSLKKGIKVARGSGTTDDPYQLKIGHSITLNDATGDIVSNKRALSGEKVTLNSVSGYYKVLGFTINGEEVTGDSFVMPDKNVVITNILTKKLEDIGTAEFESEHNPYPNGMTTPKVYGEKTFEGAEKITVTIDYQTESVNYDYINIYDANGNDISGKLGGTTRTTKTFTFSGNYIKITFRTDDSGNDYYGFKATVKAVG